MHALRAGSQTADSRCPTPGNPPEYETAVTEKKDSYTYEDLLSCGHGELFGPGNARLPLPPMLMFDRITKVNEDGGAHGKGEIHAELDIRPDLWFFACHFESDPVMPGCLGLDALWQLIGFWLGRTGAPGRGRAISTGEVKFSDQILPTSKLVSYHLDIRRFINRRLVVGVADGIVRVDGRDAYEATDIRVGLSTTTDND